MARRDSEATRSLVGNHSKPRLVVLGGEVLVTHPLPRRGSIVIGRGADCDIRIDDPSLSRRHARICLEETLTIEDLGSSNGTIIRGARLVPGQPEPLAYDEVVTLGSVAIVLQRQPAITRHRTLWGHGYFELRLDEECTRCTRAGASFGLVRVRATGDADAIADRICSALRDIDVVGVYAPGEWEVLVIDEPATAVAARAAAIADALPTCQIAAVTFPADGRDAWTLSAAVTSRLEAVVPPREPIVKSTGPMRAVYELVDQIAIGDIGILIAGETGVGKEIVAETIHRRSRRASKPLLKLNCAALPETLIESELFGHERGAFTGAAATKPGLLEQAHGGTVFLDEIGELSPIVQAKLLRVLEQREILRVGALKTTAIDVRFIAATHRDLEAAVADGTFREDLYFRLAGITVSVPPLRDRLDELAALAHHFAERAAQSLGRPAPQLAASAIETMRAYRWPGNIRELRNVIERATLLCNGTIEARHLPEDRMSRPAIVEAASGLGDVRGQARELERRAIEAALAQSNGNQTRAADLLGISRRALTNKLDQFGFARPRKRTA